MWDVSPKTGFVYDNQLMRCTTCSWAQFIGHPFDAWTAALFHCFQCPEPLPVEADSCPRLSP